jgi:hypothetical protein
MGLDTNPLASSCLCVLPLARGNTLIHCAVAPVDTQRIAARDYSFSYFALCSAMYFWIFVVVCAALTLYWATSIAPFSSTTNVERITP